ncbi:MAG: nucleotidyl transferase AbiEii/AbiGii toxin family protein [Alphaproteobacteria bacterium]|nr:nucleotidyl transferase AbiEii/AbiGii toxin family protein [Alphaproteobacteria bacterium]MDP3531710.1 nucleotidyl transferase AbiEii/AbiGii toxin family protein [Alphaproteobacteria bacterium]
MTLDYLHNHKNFDELILIVSSEMSIAPILVEKDYWIMHCLYGLQQLGMDFQMKGGTSLSKGFKIIHRFSEDIDILIKPPEEIQVYTGRNQDKPNHKQSRLFYYNWLAENIKIDGINEVIRDTAFDDEKYRSGGIRLFYETKRKKLSDVKEGILLEVGFDDITPNIAKTISSWAYDYAITKVEIIDNRAKEVPCYHPGFTLVEKLQTISTKFRKQQEHGNFSENFMRHYYDIYCLLKLPEIHDFILTNEYKDHKKKRFREGDNPIISRNEAFLIQNQTIRSQYEKEYNLSQSLYYKEKPSFSEVLKLIHDFIQKL